MDNQYYSDNPFAWHLFPFSNSRDMSCNWDVSELSSLSRMNGKKRESQRSIPTEERVSPVPQDSPTESREEDAHLDPFPEPSSFPSKWQLPD